MRSGHRSEAPSRAPPTSSIWLQEEQIMQLPALRNSVPASLNGQSIEDFIRNSTQNLQRAAAALPGSGVAGAVYLGFDGTTGVWKLNKEPIDPKGLGASWCHSTVCSKAT